MSTAASTGIVTVATACRHPAIASAISDSSAPNRGVHTEHMALTLVRAPSIVGVPIKTCEARVVGGNVLKRASSKPST